jgi:hypothetical protein
MSANVLCAASKALNSSIGGGDALYATMILLPNIIQIVHLANGDRRAVRLMIPPDGGGIRLAAIDHDGLWHAVTSGGLSQKASGRLLVALLREEESDGLVELIRRLIRGILLNISTKYITL